MAVTGIIVVHLITQRDQPYGSVRRCCERCGAMHGLGYELTHVTNEVAFHTLPLPYMACINYNQAVNDT